MSSAANNAMKDISVLLSFVAAFKCKLVGSLFRVDFYEYNVSDCHPFPILEKKFFCPVVLC